MTMSESLADRQPQPLRLHDAILAALTAADTAAPTPHAAASSPAVQVSVGCLSTQPFPSRSLIAGRSTLRTDRLVFIATAAASSHRQQSEPSLTAAFLASEYTLGSTLLVNIEKVDTSGTALCPPLPPCAMRGAVSTCLRAYVRHLVDCRAEPTSTVQVHVFARSQPQYLFAGSGRRAGKRVLGDGGLVKWWMRVLGSGLGRRDQDADGAAGGPDAERFWFVPGEGVSESSALCASLVDGRREDGWRWGLCTAGLDGDGDGDGDGTHSSREGRVLPCFPDDPVAKAVRMLGGNRDGKGEDAAGCASVRAAADVAGVQEMLGVVGECQRTCALLGVRLHVGSRARLGVSGDVGVTQMAFNEFVAAWMASDFGSEAACKASTRRLLDVFEQRFGSASGSDTQRLATGLIHVAAPLSSGASSSTAAAAAAAAAAPSGGVASDPAASAAPSAPRAPAVASIQGLVKRKAPGASGSAVAATSPASASGSQPRVHAVQALVKKSRMN